MEHTVNFEKIKDYYDRELWNIDRVCNVVNKPNSITESEYQEITGFTYPNKV